VSASPSDILAEGRPLDRFHAGTKWYKFLTPPIPIKLFSTITLMFSIGTFSVVLFVPPSVLHYYIDWVIYIDKSFYGAGYADNVNWRGWTSLLQL
jgi:hypothetical protein